MTERVQKKEPWAEKRRVTWEQADTWLKIPHNNRTLYKVKLREYGEAMKNGEWMLNGECLLFDEHGALLDGFHRLTACVQYKTSFDTFCIFGLSTNVIRTIDTGKSRSPGDMLTILNGEKNANALAAAMRWVFHLERGTVASFQSGHMTRVQLLDCLERHPGIRESVYRSSQAKKVIPGGMAVALHYLMQQKDSRLANEFFDSLLLGVNLEVGDTVMFLRERFTQGLRPGSFLARGEVVYKAALVIKAWNRWRQGNRKGGHIRWVYEGELKEPFPQIL